MQGEANATLLRLEFDPGWDGLAKTITWWDARGENPVERTLTADLLENLAESTRIYLCPIPAEALEEAGRCSFVLDGWQEGRRQRSAGSTLRVQAAPAKETDLPGALTPSQAEQLQGQMDALLSDLQQDVILSQTAAEAAQSAAETAQAAADSVSEAADHARQAARSAADAQAAQLAAEAARDQAQAIVSGDFATRTEARGYARTAEDNAKAYTDEKIAAIPAADPSGAIAAHNADQTAHGDIRAALSGKAGSTHAGQHAADGTDPITPADIGAETAGAAAAHNSDSSAHGGLSGRVEALETAMGAMADALDDLNGEVV